MEKGVAGQTLCDVIAQAQAAKEKAQKAAAFAEEQAAAYRAAIGTEQEAKAKAAAKAVVKAVIMANPVLHLLALTRELLPMVLT